MFDLRDKVAVITGAANGLGQALAIAFHHAGCHLSLMDIDLTGLQNLQHHLKKSGQRVTIHQVDVSNEKDITAARLDILNGHGRIDIVVNNAGISISQPFETLCLSDYRNVFETNFWGTVHCTKYFLPNLRNQKSSRLVNIISDFAGMGFPGKTAYASSKSAVAAFTNALTTELANTNVKVCLVIPPPLNTDLVRRGKHISESKQQAEIRFLEEHGMPLTEAANKIVRQVQRGKYRIVIGTGTFWLDTVSRFFPSLTHKLIGRYKNRFDFV